MRYRRLSYRYAMVLATGGGRSFGAPWRPPAASVSLAGPGWRPPTDVVETASEIVVTVELAGIDQEALDILLFEDALIVEGTRRLPPARAAGVYHAAEIRQGPFRLELLLPGQIDPNTVEARYDRGLLELHFVKQRAHSRVAATIQAGRTASGETGDTNVRNGDRESGSRSDETNHE
ncbi:MAG: Hsp20/alpha crystallin family protein [Chloroflexi bacterium]|nr:Hsp20/alpha crystallin family protein [Chloroflexota bacterium]